MNRLTTSALATFVFVASVAACGADDDDDPQTAITNEASTGSATKAGGSATAAGPVDVCSLLTEADAKAIVEATKSGTAGSVTFTATAKPVTSPVLGSCRLHWSGTPEGTLVIEARPGSDIDVLKGLGKPVAGLGDEAYSYTGTTNVRVGNVMLAAGENSFTESFLVEVLKRMAPRLKR